MTDGIFLLLGCNIGDRIQRFREAEEQLALRQVYVLQRSSMYETAAWGPIPQDDFLNCVIQVLTKHPPLELLEIILETEEAMGRKRTEKWGPRLIDIDILYYNDEVIRTDALSIPHPFIPERRFTLEPLAEIAGDFIHPVLKKDQRTLLAECADPLEVRKL